VHRVRGTVAAHGNEDGFTLIELLVAMLLLTIVGAIFTAAFVDLQRSLRKQNGLVDSQATTRNVFETLDRSVRYANGISSPGTAADGNLYVEWQTGDVVSGQTCNQWRVIPATGVLQSRTWVEPTNGTLPLPTAWTTKAVNVVTAGLPAVFATELKSSNVSGIAQAVAGVQRQLAVNLTVSSGGTTPGVSSASTVFTAANSSVNSSSVCTDVSRA